MGSSQIYYSVYQINLAQESEKWRDVLNTVMNLWVIGNTGNFSTS
jgi:hypothetical protein